MPHGKIFYDFFILLFQERTCRIHYSSTRFYQLCRGMKNGSLLIRHLIHCLICNHPFHSGISANGTKSTAWRIYKNYIKEVLKFRSAQDALDEFLSLLNALIETIVTEAKSIAQTAKRSTIMKKDIIAALEKHVFKRHLTWEETAEEIILQNPTDLGKISKAINDYIDTHTDNK